MNYLLLPSAPVPTNKRELFVVVGFTQSEVSQLTEGGHAAACLRRVDLRVDDRLILTDCSGGKSNLLRFRVDTQDLEVHLLTELNHVVRLRHPLFRKFGDVTEALEIVIQFDESAEVRETRYLAMNHIARFVFGRKLLPGIRFQILYGERQSPVLGVDAGNHRIDL